MLFGNCLSCWEILPFSIHWVRPLADTKQMIDILYIKAHSMLQNSHSKQASDYKTKAHTLYKIIPIFRELPVSEVRQRAEIHPFIVIKGLFAGKASLCLSSECSWLWRIIARMTQEGKLLHWDACQWVKVDVSKWWPWIGWYAFTLLPIAMYINKPNQSSTRSQGWVTGTA